MSIYTSNKISAVTITGLLGASIQLGSAAFGNTFTEWVFPDDQIFIGFTGQYVDDILSKMGVLIYEPDCGLKAY